MESNNGVQWLSASSLAKIVGCSKQTIYNRIKSGLYEVQRFERGKMNGVLVKYVAN